MTGTPQEIWGYCAYMHNRECEKVTVFNDALQQLVANLWATMYARSGRGVAAPQIGQFVAVAVLEEKNDRIVLINPEITDSIGECGEMEGCLSLPPPGNNTARVWRAKQIQVQYQDEAGVHHNRHFSGDLARVMQHEIDHLKGMFFTDRLGKLAADIVLRKYKKFCEHNCEEDR
jgi:peptide deformylase